ncbi:hypothetical protein YB2330_001278 [Saitoella coloradoensis]|uniref:ChrR-like cupin domain-containing protein n=1 Tax=Saitoella complicata (strain BCRC 22490 / CBS 7301 / JCM 7358 / NBRC 10748 / NRRL Y-17804) TaxID=698492 RepID=A0A0E9NPA1_SAICN|nr:uncharacterized protein SAICODRAFT_4161 [Saitoella complicata NRRL Y-17804]ODQ55941.1 hypothetical protein SAICODRAFT_4161 [Saitoella complicata NRRL Y-17804]GAO51496.1 hypothetical protein G7K_5595-t1 [Saitoella complicata NRRL Y-17804]
MAPGALERRISSESKLSPLDRAEMALVDAHGAPDVYVNGKTDTCWHPWVGDLLVKPLRYEPKSGDFVIVLRAPNDTVLGKHRHRGVVTATTLKGKWNYFEYDWVAQPGDYVVENPGTIHTLHMYEDTEVLFTVSGSIEFFNDDDTLRNTMDLFSFMHLYKIHCEKTGQKFNTDLVY